MGASLVPNGGVIVTIAMEIQVALFVQEDKGKKDLSQEKERGVVIHETADYRETTSFTAS